MHACYSPPTPFRRIFHPDFVNYMDSLPQVVDEVSGSKDVRELLLSSLTQADKLTRLVDEKLSLNETRLHVTESGDRDSGGGSFSASRN